MHDLLIAHQPLPRQRRDLGADAHLGRAAALALALALALLPGEQLAAASGQGLAPADEVVAHQGEGPVGQDGGRDVEEAGVARPQPQRAPREPVIRHVSVGGRQQAPLGVGEGARAGGRRRRRVVVRVERSPPGDMVCGRDGECARDSCASGEGGVGGVGGCDDGSSGGCHDGWRPRFGGRESDAGLGTDEKRAVCLGLHSPGSIPW